MHVEVFLRRIAIFKFNRAISMATEFSDPTCVYHCSHKIVGSKCVAMVTATEGVCAFVLHCYSVAMQELVALAFVLHKHCWIVKLYKHSLP